MLGCVVVSFNFPTSKFSLVHHDPIIITFQWSCEPGAVKPWKIITWAQTQKTQIHFFFLSCLHSSTRVLPRSVTSKINAGFFFLLAKIAESSLGTPALKQVEAPNTCGKLLQWDEELTQQTQQQSNKKKVGEKNVKIRSWQNPFKVKFPLPEPDKSEGVVDSGGGNTDCIGGGEEEEDDKEEVYCFHPALIV